MATSKSKVAALGVDVLAFMRLYRHYRSRGLSRRLSIKFAWSMCS